MRKTSRNTLLASVICLAAPLAAKAAEAQIDPNAFDCSELVAWASGPVGSASTSQITHVRHDVCLYADGHGWHRSEGADERRACEPTRERLELRRAYLERNKKSRN